MNLDCGIQLRLPGTRRTVGPGIARTETFRQKQVNRFDDDYLFRTEERSAGRYRATWRLLAILSFLRNYGSIPANPVVNWDRAHVQAIHGDRFSDAAHNLPCQILINGQVPWALVSGNDINTALIVSELREAFGNVRVGPKVFNAADSIAEANCLRGALVEACTEVIGKSAPIRRAAGVVKRGFGLNYGEILLTTADMANPGAGIDHATVRTAFDTWIGHAAAAFDRAVKDVERNGATSWGEDVTEEVVYILQRYKQFTLKNAVPPSDTMLSQFEETFWRAAGP
jgi:hypothetical protein